MSDNARDQLADMLPLGYTDRDPYRNVFEAADAIMASDWLNEQLVEAWDRGHDAGVADAYDPGPMGAFTTNPYRKADS